jgi:biotin carboxyl carrier protein
VFLDGRSYVVTDDAGPRGPTGHDGGDDQAAVSAPMPATVTAIKVAAGSRVARGDVLLTLEAMKMVLPITAPRDATVKAIRCHEGDLVEAGVPLVEFEP